MNIGTLLGAIILYLFLVGVLTIIGSKRKIGRVRMFLLSFTLTPLTGLLVYNLSEPVEVLKLTRYRCPKCGIDFTETLGECPYCRRDGLFSRLHTVKMRTI